MTAHSLTFGDRDARHRLWLPICTCGKWRGVPRRRRVSAEKQYRRHIAGLESAARTASRGERVRARATTPYDELPEALR